MTFWIIAAGAALILAFFLFRTLISPVPSDESETQLAIYKDQLSEIERDEARGTLTADEAKRLRTEVSRRILTADDAQTIAPKSMSATEVAVVVAIVVVTLLGGGLWTYAKLGVPGYDDLPRAERFARAAEMRENRATQEDVWNRLPAEGLNEAEGRPSASFSPSAGSLFQTSSWVARFSRISAARAKRSARGRSSYPGTPNFA